MTESRSYYEACDDRYRQVHGEKLRWLMEEPSPIVGQVLSEYGIPADAKLQEIGCGEGRDARFLLNRGYDVLATDVSAEAIVYCHRENPKFAARFQMTRHQSGAG